MKVLYGSRDLQDIVETIFEELTDQSTLNQLQLNELKENRKKEKKALFFIFKEVDEAVFERISSVNSAKQAWDTHKDQVPLHSRIGEGWRCLSYFLQISRPNGRLVNQALQEVFVHQDEDFTWSKGSRA